MHKLYQRLYELCASGANRSSKDLRRAKSSQAISTVVQVVRARSTRVELRLEACEGCTSCINGGASGTRQEHTV